MGWLTITRFTLKEIVRRWIFLAIVVLTALMLGVFALLLNAVTESILTHRPDEPQFVLLGVGVLMSLLASWSVYLQTSVMTVLLTAGMLSAEVEAGTLAIIVPKPLARAEIVLGKWLAYALVLGGYTALLALAFLGVIYWKTGYWPEQWAGMVAMLELNMLTLLALLTLVGAFWPTLVNGAVVVVLFIGAPLASIAQFVLQGQSLTIERITTAIDLVMPSDALWHAAASYLLPPSLQDLVRLHASTQDIPLVGAQSLSPALAIWIALYIVVLPLLGIWRFQWRDL